VGLHKIFNTLLEEEKGALRNTYFALLLLIDPITTMSTLVVEIFDRHVSDMKFQFGGMIIQMKPIHVCLILGLRVSLILNEFLFVDLEHITNFKMRRFLKKKNTYGLKEIDGALKQAKLERHHVGALAIDSSFSATDIGAIVVKVCSQLEEHDKMLLKLEDHDGEVEVDQREVNLEAISYEYGGDLLEWKNSDEKDDDVEKDGEEKAKSVEEEQPQVAEEED
ncbi:hypothetical protein GIB67_025814, partial [Kingdonia uniflora]